jgi:hypothetical protein
MLSSAEAETNMRTSSDRRIDFDKAFWLKGTVSAGLFTGLLLSHKLWTNAREYPLTPVWSFLKPLVFPFDYIVLTVMLALLAAITVVAKPVKLIFGFILLAILYASFDQSRWQPWFYQYLFMLATIMVSYKSATEEDGDKTLLSICRLIVVSIYFWSAIQKFNAGFVHETFPWLMEPLGTLLPAALKTRLHLLGFGATVMELGIAIGLLIRKLRTAAVVLCWSTHLFILACIGPWARNHNNVVWPWNIAMGVFVGLLFWRESDIRLRDVLWGSRTVLQFAVLLLFGIAPVLNLSNDWDSYLSFGLYSGNYNSAAIYMTHAAAQTLPENVHKFVVDEGAPESALYLCDWAWGELNVPPYPEIRIFKSVGRKVCDDTANSSDVSMVVQEKTTLFRPGQQHIYDCSSLSK